MANARKLQQIWTEKGMYVGIKKKNDKQKGPKKRFSRKMVQKRKRKQAFHRRENVNSS